MRDRWTELRTLFDELVEMDTAGREARLREIGAGEPALRARLEALLGADSSGEAKLLQYGAAARSVLAGAAPKQTDPLGLIGSTVDEYRIDSVLGAGGMSVVYRATDVRLGRVAALKFLPPGWSLDGRAKGRFLNEARAAASLDHPNVCAIYGAGETPNGTMYIAMACYEGETLRDRLERGPLDVDEAIDLAAQAARGLAAAHAQGLVHRDIKPTNLLVTRDGSLKILDFGIAKAADLGLTGPDQRPGTAAYMAPEQARGDAVDGRADVWSLGLMLYTMLTGTRPDDVGLPDARPPAPSTLRPGVPAAIDALILQLLEYHPDARPERVEDIVTILESQGEAASSPEVDPAGVARRHRRRAFRVATGRSSPATVPPSDRRAVAYAGAGILIALVGIGSYVYWQDGPPTSSPSEAVAVAAAPRSLAVLPFANTSPDAQNGFFADGVTDDVSMHLAQVPDFSVISRTTTMGYKESGKTVPEIAAELGVQYVLEGSVRRDGNQVRITARLVDAQADQYLWAEAYDRQLEDIFAVQTEIARSIVDALEVRLSTGVAARIDRPHTENLEAYDLFLLGRESLYQYDPEGIERAMALFSSALELDPAFALARAWLSRALAMYVYNQGLGPAGADSSVAVARRAIADRPDLSDAHTALGTALWVAGRHDEASAAFERALDLNPNDWIATHNFGDLHAALGTFDEAIRLTRRSIDLEPVRLQTSYGNLSSYYASLGLFDQAESALERAVAVAPDAPAILRNAARLELLRGRAEAAIPAASRLAGYAAEDPGAAMDAAHLFIWAGEVDRALELAETAYAHSPMTLRTYLVGVLYGYALQRTGETGRADAVLNETERYARDQIEAGHEGADVRYSLACLHAIRGERENAFRWLDDAIDSGWNLAGLVATDPLMEGLRDDPRFDAALDRMELDLSAMRERVEREGL